MAYIPAERIKRDCEELGSGTYGSVFKLVDNCGNARAVKLLESHDEAQKEKLLNEVKLLKSCNHPNIVQFLEVYDEGETVHVYMPIKEKGSIHDLVKDKNPLSETLARKYTKDVCNGLKYLHDKKILHRDIKGQNILIDKNDNASLADFGLSIEVISNMTTKRSKVGTLYFISPEVLNSDRSGRRADVWSLGCAVVEMLTAFPPWAQFKPAAAMKMIIKNPNNPHLAHEIPINAQGFLRLIFVEKERRCYIEELLNHQWLNDT